MSLTRSHETGAQSSGNKFSRLRGWIDLNKTKTRLLLVAVIAMLAATVLGSVVNKSLGFSESQNKYGLWSWFGSASTTTGQGELKLSKEYLYSDQGLFAIEDAEATSVPPADLAIWRPSSGQWWTMAGQHSAQVTIQWGIATDVPSIGDYDGDGKTDFCVFRPTEGRWYLIESGSGDASTSVVNFGSNGDVPAAADYDGDGKTDMAVWRPANGYWFVRKSSDNSMIQLPLGSAGDVPSPKDYDGDGKADIAVWRSATATFYSINSSDGVMKFTNMGIPGVPVSADYDGDGRDDHAVRDGAIWKIRQSSDDALVVHAWQDDEDVSVQNDYDGDGRVDIAAWSPDTGNWHIRQSSNGATRIEQWGINGDIPLPALYRR